VSRSDDLYPAWLVIATVFAIFLAGLLCGRLLA
jgi:hypothetical protein